MPMPPDLGLPDALGLADTIERWADLDADFKGGLAGSPDLSQALRRLMARQQFPDFAPLTREDAWTLAGHLWPLVPADGRSTVTVRLDATGSLAAGQRPFRLWFGDFRAGEMVTVSRQGDVFHFAAGGAALAHVTKRELLAGFAEAPSLFVDGFEVLPLP